MAKLKALDTFYTDETKQVRGGDVIDVVENHTRELIAAGLAEAVPAPKEEAAPVEKPVKRARKK